MGLVQDTLRRDRLRFGAMSASSLSQYSLDLKVVTCGVFENLRTISCGSGRGADGASEC